jgi:hypothetical protein
MAMAMLKPAPGGRLPESKSPSSLVTLCEPLAWLVNVMLSPGWTVWDCGWKPESVIVIWVVAANDVCMPPIGLERLSSATPRVANATRQSRGRGRFTCSTLPARMFNRH